MLTILIDDLRDFKDGRERLVARTDAEGLDLLKVNRGVFIDELWLDHDLGMLDGEKITIKSVVYELEYCAFHGKPYQIGKIFVHSSNAPGAAEVVKGLTRQGYDVERVTFSPALDG